jgi:hypothetical protein
VEAEKFRVLPDRVAGPDTIDKVTGRPELDEAESARLGELATTFFGVGNVIAC